MSNKITIREYSINDKDAVLNLLLLNIPKYFAPSEALDFEKYLENQIAFYYVLLSDSEVVGCGGINFEENQKTGIISWDVFHPKFQGRSLGSQLVQYRVEKLQSMENIEKIVVRTSQLTFKFYEKQGFILVEVHKNYWADGFDLYYMEYCHTK